MRKLLALLLLLVVSPAFAQEVYPPPPIEPVAIQTYTLDPTTVPLQNIQQEGTPLTLYDDGNVRVQLPFEFYFFGNPYTSINVSQNGYISFTSDSQGCCDGKPLPDFDLWGPYSDTRNSIFAMWNDLIDSNNPGNPYIKNFGNKFVVGWYNIEELGSYSQQCEFNLLGIPLFCNNIGPNTFNYEITLFKDTYDFSINYGNINFPTVREFEHFTVGYQGDTTSEVNQIYYGNNPSFLANTTYTFVSSYTPLPPATNNTVDCTLEPLNPDCAVLVYTDPNLIANSLVDEVVADASDTTTEDTTTTEEVNTNDEEVMVADESTSTDSEKELADDEEEEEAVVSSTTPEGSSIIYVTRELTDEEKAAILADAISKSTLESALSIAGNAAVAGSSAGTTEQTSSGTTTRKDNADGSVEVSVGILAETTQSNQVETQDTSGALDILETGRIKGQEALAATMAATENSANDSINQAESVAANSAASSYANNNDDSLMVGGSAISSTGEVTTVAEMAAAESVAQAEAIALASIEASKQASQSAFDDGTNADADLVNTMIDPGLAMATAMNNVPNVANLEILGVIKAPVEEKSDAEKRAAEVVAANQQQMEEINKNYMEADQSGIVAAMGADTDVNSYRTAMIADAAQWYKDKDIYKGVIIKDNVRGSYFLEKGNTDTFKKMVEEQYK